MEVNLMDNQRAKEIISSPNMIDVTYNGKNIYMESLNESDQCCIIHFVNQPVTKLNVPLTDLKENRAN
jgi:small acid-soluble spore protein H (minor)